MTADSDKLVTTLAAGSSAVDPSEQFAGTREYVTYSEDSGLFLTKSVDQAGVDAVRFEFARDEVSASHPGSTDPVTE